MTDTDTTQDVNTEVDAQDADTDTTHQANEREQDSQPTGFDALPKETQDEIKALRRENAKHRKALKEREDAEKTELQRLADANGELTQKYADLESKYRNTVAESAFTEAATKANAIAPKTLFRAYRDDLEFDDDGSVTNVEAVIEKARKDEPGLFRTNSADGGKGSPVSNQDMNQLIRRAAGRK